MEFIVVDILHTQYILIFKECGTCGENEKSYRVESNIFQLANFHIRIPGVSE